MSLFREYRFLVQHGTSCDLKYRIYFLELGGPG